MNICKKTAYSTKEFADDDIKRFQKKNRINKPTKSYLCQRCNMWHITSNNSVLFEKIDKLEKENYKLKIDIKQKSNFAINNKIQILKIKHQKQIDNYKQKLNHEKFKNLKLLQELNNIKNKQSL